MINDDNKMEIKIESRGSYYKSKILSIIKPLGIILACILALYVGFYVLLFFILFSGLSYLFRNIFKK
jgi:hypothetical protein